MTAYDTEQGGEPAEKSKTMTDKTMTLEPCPFCGHTGPFDQWPCEWLDGSGDNAIRCPMCHGAAKATTWNRRHISQPAERGEAVAWLVVDEEGSPSMLFFDRVEALAYCDDDEQPTPLYTAPPPAAGVPDAPLLGVVWNERTEAAHLIKRGTEDEFCADYGCRRVFITPSPTIDVAAVREVIAELIDYDEADGEALNEWANELARAIGDAK
ncbi:MAG TPA: hypothetical protein VFQ32_09115 [Ktedonobacterales bacterium]|nr:hypothetical protein [Ktedonobacterales bacterium]